VRAHSRNAAAAPATVSGEPKTNMPLEPCSGKAAFERPTREPGDLPSFVVTRDSVGRGAPMRAKPIVVGVALRSNGPRLLRALHCLFVQSGLASSLRHAWRCIL
jgi:hypothetical protein